MATFPVSTASVMNSAGWIVGKARAIRTFTLEIKAIVNADGRWQVTNHGGVIGTGEEDHPALAAMEANECAWRARDRVAP